MTNRYNLLDKDVEKIYRTSRTNESFLSIKFYLNNILFVKNVTISTRASEQSAIFISIEDFFLELQNKEYLYFVSVTFDEYITWDEETVQSKLNNIKRPLCIELGSSVSTKVYINYPDKEQVIIIDLNNSVYQMAKKDLLAKLKNKDTFGIHLIIEALKQGLIGYFNERPDYHLSLTDVTFFNNEASSEEASDYISLDYTWFQNDILSSCWLSLHIYNTLYDEIRSNNIHFFETLNEKCNKYCSSERFNIILPKLYDEIILKSLRLTKEIKFVIEDKIINFSFLSDGTKENENDVIVLLRKRIDALCANIECLNIKYLATDEKFIDGEFLFTVKFIAQNIHILKHQLKITYDRLPWEEMEFCLVSFISCHTKHEGFNFLCKIILDKKKIITFLEIFKVELNKLKNNITEKDINGRFPDQINKIDLPGTFELYSDYYIIKDIYSLKRMDHYVTLALEIDIEEDYELGKLVTERALQVMGESIKNTLESPNLSDEVRGILYDSASRNVKDIISSLRDSLSHLRTLNKKINFEDRKNFYFFKTELRNDLQKMKYAVNDVYYKKRLDIIKLLINKIIKSDDLLEAKELFNILSRTEYGNIKTCVIKELAELKKLIERLRQLIKNKTEEEESCFDKIDEILISQENSKIKNDNIKSLQRFSSININSLKSIKGFCREYLNVADTLMRHDHLNLILLWIIDIYKSAAFRNQYSYELYFIYCRIFYIIEFDVGRIQGVNEFNKTLLKKDDDVENKATETIKNIFDKIIMKVKEISDQDSIKLREVYIERQESYQDFKIKSEELEKVKVEMISILDMLENQQISRNDALVQPTFAKLDKLVNTKPLKKIFDEAKWMDCKKKVRTLIISRDYYDSLFTSVKNCITDEKDDMSTCFKDFVNSFKLKKTLLLNVRTIIDSIFKDGIQVFFEKRLDILKQLLSFFNNDKSSLQKYMDDEKLQAAVEMLVLDLSEILQSHGIFSDNRISLETWSPVLMGNTLRNYLAHGNALIDILPCDPSTAILSNALRFIKEGNDLINKENLFIGQSNVESPFDLTNHSFDLVTNQNDMFTAVKEGNLEKIKHHINKGADIKGRDYKGWSGLHFAAQGNFVEILEFILDRDPSPDIQNIDGETPLHVAATFGNDVVLKYLLEKGADVNTASNNNMTPLHLATRNGHIEVVKTLVQNKANINDKTKDNLTALELAVFNDYRDIFEYLMQNGSTVDTLLNNVKSKEDIAILEAKDKDVVTLYYAVCNEQLDVIEGLLKEGADVNFKDINDITLLQLASKNGFVEVVEILLKYGANIDFATRNVCSALYLASSYGYERVVDILLQNNAYINAQNVYGDTPLHCAIMFGHDKVVEALLKGNIDVEVANKLGKTALHVAASCGHTNIIELLLTSNANINALDITNWTPLHWAAGYGKKDAVNQLLMKGAVFGITDQNGLTALDIAMVKGHSDVVKQLLIEKTKVDALRNECDASLLAYEVSFKKFIFSIKRDDEGGVKSFLDKHGDKVNVLDENGLRPLEWAICSGHDNIVKLLLDKGADCNLMVNNVKSLLHLAIEFNVSGNNKSIQMLIDAGAKVDAQDNSKMTPLHHASINGNREIVQILIDAGANVDVQDNSKMTPLHHASSNGYMEIVEMLLLKLMDIDPRDIVQMTPLHHAVYENRRKVVELLLSKGANVNIKEFKGRTPLHLAVDKSDKYMVDLLLYEGADVNHKTDKGWTPLHFAANKGDKYMVELLLEKCVDVDAKTCNGMTSLHFGVKQGYEGVVERLLKEGADINTRDIDGKKPQDYCDVSAVQRLLQAYGVTLSNYVP